MVSCYYINLMDYLETQLSSTALKHFLVSYEKNDFHSQGFNQPHELKRYSDNLSPHSQQRPHKRIRVQSSKSNPRYLCLPQWCQKNPHFTGRATLLETIHTKLCDTALKEYNHRLAIYGMGGVGKTQIAIEYVTQFQTEYVGIYWITASNKAELLSGFQTIAKETHCVEIESLNSSEIAQQVLNWFYKSEDWLLILDNLDDITIADGYIPRLRTGGGHVLITTRNPNSLNIPAEGIQIEVHKPEEAKELLLRRAQLFTDFETTQEVDEEARKIVETLGYLALAIEQAAAYIREELKDIFAFRSIYSVQRTQFHSWQLTGNLYYKNTVATTWLMSMEVIQQRNPMAVHLLQLFAFMNPDGISLGFLKAARHSLPKDFQPENETIFIANLMKALGDLGQFSLIFQPNSKIIVIH